MEARHCLLLGLYLPCNYNILNVRGHSYSLEDLLSVSSRVEERLTKLRDRECLRRRTNEALNYAH